MNNANGFVISDGIIIKYNGSETDLVIPDGVVGIGSAAFSKCRTLTAVTVGGNVKFIGDNAFEFCSGLCRVSISGSVEGIGKWAFTHCRSLESVTFAEGVRSIGKAAFEYCGSLEQVSLPDSLTELGSHAFYQCGQLKSVQFGKSLKEINEYTLFLCPALKQVTLPEMLENVSPAAFPEGCLNSVTVPEGMTDSAVGNFLKYNLVDNVYFKNRRCEDVPDVITKRQVIPGFAQNYEKDSPPKEITDSYVEYFKAEMFNEIGYNTVILFPELIRFAVSFSALTGEEADLLLSMLHGFGDGEIRAMLLEYKKSLTGQPEPSSDGISLAETAENWKFKKNKDGTVTLTEYIGNEDTVICPEKVCARCVTGIGKKAFYFCKSVKSAVIPECIKSIGSELFNTDIFFLYTDIETVYFKNRPFGLIPDEYKNKTALLGFVLNFEEDSPPEEITASYADYFKRNLYGIGFRYIAEHTRLIEFAVQHTILTAEEAGAVLSLMPENCNAELRAELIDYINSREEQSDEFSLECAPLEEIVSEWETSINDDGTLTLNKYIGSRLSVICPDTICGKPVTGIGDCAFSHSEIASVFIPESITVIGNYAFSHCAGLESIVIPRGVAGIGMGTFNNCGSLRSVEFLGRISIPRDQTFLKCDNLKSVIFHEGAEIIGKETFKYCKSLETVSINGSVGELGSGAFYFCESLKSFTVPDGVTEIKKAVFYCCKGLETVTLPESVTSIGKEAFYLCESLASITLPAGLTCIGSEAFRYCKSIKSLSIPAGTEKVGERAFYKCSGLETVTFPQSVTFTGFDVFAGCNMLSASARFKIKKQSVPCGE